MAKLCQYWGKILVNLIMVILKIFMIIMIKKKDKSINKLIKNSMQNNFFFIY